MKTHWKNPAKPGRTLCGAKIQGKLVPVRPPGSAYVSFEQARPALPTSDSEDEVTCRRCQQADVARQLRQWRADQKAGA